MGALGWGWPAAAAKAHVFPKDDGTSLCGRWLYMGRMTAVHPSAMGEKPGPDDCTPCWRKAQALLAQAD